MDFTSKTNIGFVVTGILIIAVVGSIGLVHHVTPTPAPMMARPAEQGFLQASGSARAIPGVVLVPAGGLQTPPPGYYQPVTHWYKNKHWWKRNAPIIGGAAGGGLIGGLAGGGTGAVIGAAAGGAGGYLYKRHRHHHSSR